MEFRDLKKQYNILKADIDEAIKRVCQDTDFIHGAAVVDLEKKLADYVGVKHCISCANGTDALQLALMCWGIRKGDAVFVPDFTFFSTGEAPAVLGATPIFVDVDENTYNISSVSLEQAISAVIEDGVLIPRVIITVDLFGQPANYGHIRKIADKYGLWILEDGAQGFGGQIGDRKACSFGDVATTSFFPAKPLGCYGDGGAIFTDNDEWAEKIQSLCVHGKGKNKYENIRIGMNSRLDTLQAEILQIKLRAFQEKELAQVNIVAKVYERELSSIVKVPIVPDNYLSSWAQYTIQLYDETSRDKIISTLIAYGIPTAVYYATPLHRQKAFCGCNKISINDKLDVSVSEKLSNRVLSLPISPYISQEEQHSVIVNIKKELCI